MAKKPPKEPKPPLEPKATTDKGWAKAETITPVLTPRLPAELSDGSGLSFTPEALLAPVTPLDPGEPGVSTLITQIDFSAEGASFKLPWKKDPRSPEELAEVLDGWRLLAETENQRIFGKGVPPRLVTVGLKLEGRGRWTVQGVSPGRQVRAARGQIRASSFRVDPDRPLSPEDTVLRLLVVEQTRSGGRLAHGRFQEPDLYVDDEELLLRCFITPLEGWQTGTRRWETPVLVQLPDRVGGRKITDGAIYFQGAPKQAR
jgi:hypothetical protein